MEEDGDQVFVSVKHSDHIVFKQLPDWMRDNEFIRKHFRPELRWQQQISKTHIFLN